MGNVSCVHSPLYCYSSKSGLCLPRDSNTAFCEHVLETRCFPPSVKGEGKRLLSLGCYIQRNVLRNNRSNQCEGSVDAEFCL